MELRFRVHGRVQGVGFRWWTRSQARRLALTGSVRNLPDGSVEVQARGPAEALAQLRALLRRGPPGAWVDRVDEYPATGTAEDDFEIERY